MDGVYADEEKRLGAWRLFLSLSKTGRTPVEDLIRATENYAVSVAGVEPKWIMVGTTFFGPDQPWRDYLDGPHPERHKSRGGPTYTPEQDALFTRFCARDLDGLETAVSGDES